MTNIVELLELKDIIATAGYDPTTGFESLYSQLHANDPQSSLIKQIEHRVEKYFGDLVLPDFPTMYDLLLLLLRSKDAIFTFNWDPFLVDSYMRHAGSIKLPHIFHLHGNARVCYCDRCGKSMEKSEVCPNCCCRTEPTRLLYPVEQKNYTNDPFIASQWQQARDYIRSAGIITIFGYSAPRTDKEAMAIFIEAWKGDDPKKPIERLEIIDVRNPEQLASQWSPFAFFEHYDIHRSFYESLLSRYPRRSCEALMHMGFDGNFVEPITWYGNLNGLRKSITELAACEN